MNYNVLGGILNLTPTLNQLNGVITLVIYSQVKLFMSRTSGHTQKLVISGVIVVFHLLFLIYLHFAYHRVVEGIFALFTALYLSILIVLDTLKIYLLQGSQSCP